MGTECLAMTGIWKTPFETKTTISSLRHCEAKRRYERLALWQSVTDEEIECGEFVVTDCHGMKDASQ